MALAVEHPALWHELDRGLRKARIVHGGAIVAGFWITLTGLRIAPAAPWDAPFEDDAPMRWLLRAGFGLFALVEVLTVAHLRRRLLDDEREVRVAFMRTNGSPVVNRLFGRAVLSAAFTEATLIFGLMLTLLGGEPFDFLAFGAAALVLFALWFPRRADWESNARRAQLEPML